MSTQSNPLSIVVTGARGYVGRHVVTDLLERGHDVTAVVRPGRADGVDERARIVEADILAPGFDPAAIVGETTDAFIHLAWEDGFTHNAPSHMRHLSAHFDLITSVAAAGVRRIAVLGTMHEIGYHEGAITAETPTNPRSLYGVAKDALRRSLFLAIPEDIELTWLRCYYIYGDDRRNNSIFTRLLEAVEAGRETMPFTTGKNKYDFIHVDELAHQISAVAIADGVRGIVNCSSGEPVSLADRVEGFIRENDLPIALEYGAFPDRPYDSPAVWGDAEIVRGVLAREN
ncbi:NAD-dependent epimerase/dehydratase family protein [Microbacterium sp. NPDC089189]|uniref:NAD-dependent epimerase/dehydratase family protein n=1 Tax=Microbacterium sp. NPDC089189 TaxID=3154972 RepID=UPI003447B53D